MVSDPNFLKAVEFTLISEGPMSNDALDPGGLTKYGISKAAYPNLDIANLTKEQALDVYYTDYWQRVGCSLLPFAFALAVFECAVNQGQGTAIRCLQSAVGVTSDGKLGPASLKAISLARSSPRVLASFLALRVQRYVEIKDKNPALYAKNMNGWFIRLFLCTIAGAQE